MQYTEPTLIAAFNSGSLRFAYGVSPWIFALLAAAIVAAVWLTYLKTTRPLTAPWKFSLIALRSSALILLLFCLLRPIISTTQVSPQETYLALLVDNSQSMEIADMPGDESRRQAALERLVDGGVSEALAENFQLRSFSFDKQTSRLVDLESFDEPGTSSSLDQALDFVQAQLNGLPLAGIVVLSDGGNNLGPDPIERAREFGARSVPVFTVGVGQETIPRDVGILDVSAAKTVLEGSVFSVQVALSHEGFSGETVRLSISDQGVEAASEVITLDTPGVPRRYELDLTPEREEAIVYDLEVELLDGELIAENNRYSFLVDNSPKPPLDVLYIEGHPRNEYKFIRRAVAGDESIRLVTYLQTGPEKYYRQGINSPTELSEGFPADKETLFEYEAIVLGDIEKEFFSDEQLGLIEDFVAERGGGLLVSGMLDEEFIGTPLADALPVTLVEESFLPPQLRGGIRRGDHPTGEVFVPRRTSAGEFSPLLRLANGDDQNRQTWQQLPELQGVYVTGRIKPGAEVLLEHPLLQYQNQALPVIATQRFGRGRSMAITTASTWRWQMMQPADDQSHEVLWRQLLRWASVSSPERITLDFDREFYNIGDEVNVTATVLDERFVADNDATLWLQVSDPLLQAQDIPMQWDIAEDGVYRASFIAEQQGVFDLLVDVASAAGTASVDAREKRSSLVVTPSLREYTDAQLDSGLLGRLAEASGGSYFPLARIGELPEAVEFTPNAYSREVQIDLWDKPWLLALLIALMSADWILRRLRGLS